jgi:hypothetical protein
VFVGGEIGISRGDEIAVENEAKDDTEDDVAAEFKLASARLFLAVDFMGAGTGVVAIDNGPSSRLIVDNPCVVPDRFFTMGIFSFAAFLLPLPLQLLLVDRGFGSESDNNTAGAGAGAAASVSLCTSASASESDAAAIGVEGNRAAERRFGDAKGD